MPWPPSLQFILLHTNPIYRHQQMLLQLFNPHLHSLYRCCAQKHGEHRARSVSVAPTNMAKSS
jgi:hypothetical protein